MVETMKVQTNLMQEDFELSLRPWIALYDTKRIEEEEEKIAYYYTLVNLGKLPALIKSIKIKNNLKEKILYEKDNVNQMLMP